MRVILTSSVPNLGAAGDIKDVSPNYARHVLLKNKQAEIATPEAIKRLEKKRAKSQKDTERAAAQLASTANKLKNITISITTQANDKGKLFAGITPKALVTELHKQHKLELPANHIILKKPIKDIGSHKAEYKLSNNLSGEFKIEVKKA